MSVDWRPRRCAPLRRLLPRSRLPGLAIACLVILSSLALPVFAQDAGNTPTTPAVITPHGEPQAEKSPRDADFGVATKHAGLQRHVEMYQWLRAGNDYVRGWRGARVDSSGFAPGHDNPRVMPLREREWRATMTLDGRHLSAEIVNALGEWRTFRPGFSALPANMAATFQPEGDGLGSAENPLAPQVGDLRVTWRAFVLPPLARRLVLENKVWILRGPVAVSPAGMPETVAAPDVSSVQEENRDLRGWIMAGAGLLALLLVAGAVRGSRRKPRA